jgi:aspartyl-tRNA(Asn)/glutamyl-tRNA(Gln) amidotransferase subunit A
MDKKGGKMDRRTFMKSTLAAGAGLAVATSMGDLAWGKGYSDADLADLSLYEQSKMIRTGEITSKRLVEIYLDRIQKYSGPEGVNAYITVASELALKSAEELDKSAESKNFKGPLHGLPIAVKDNIDTMDIRTTGGSSILAQWKPKRDGHVVEKLKQAGAIILGKTNMHEFNGGLP